MKFLLVLFFQFSLIVSYGQIFKYSSNNTTDTLYSNFVGIRSYNYKNSDYCNKNIRNDKVKKTIIQTWFYKKIELAEIVYFDEKIFSIEYFNNNFDSIGVSLYIEFDMKGFVYKETYTFRLNQTDKIEKQIVFYNNQRGLRVKNILISDD